MEADNSLTNGYCLKAKNEHYVYYQEDTDHLEYAFAGKSKKVIAVDTRKAYKEIDLGVKKKGRHEFKAPYVSDWAIAVEH